MNELTTLEINQLTECEDTIERGLNTFVEVGNALMTIRDNRLYRASYGTFEDYCRDRWGMARRTAYQLMDAAEVVENVRNCAQIAPANEAQARPLTQLPPAQQAEAWQRAVETAPNSNITSKHIQRVVEEYKETTTKIITKIAVDAKTYYTIPEWLICDDRQKQDILLTKGSKELNKQDSDNIEWARWSWNPITGCLHNCSYCYARDIANRFYPQGFEPVLMPERLTAPQNTKLPDLDKFTNPVDKIGWRNIFTCSMADLFGKWVPDEWIERILEEIRNNPQWNFLLLTKFPIRMAEFEYPSNAWIGTTVDKQFAVDRAEKAFHKIRETGYSGIAWLSCEPMLERLTFTSLSMFDWVVVGGASSSTKTPEFRPPREWINHIESQAMQSDCKIYEKSNLLERIREYPFE